MYLSGAAARETQVIIKGEGGTCVTAVGDVTDEKQVEALVADYLARFGRIDILVNNVGKSEPAIAGEIEVALWDRQRGRAVGRLS